MGDVDLVLRLGHQGAFSHLIDVCEGEGLESTARAVGNLWLGRYHLATQSRDAEARPSSLAQLVRALSFRLLGQPCLALAELSEIPQTEDPGIEATRAFMLWHRGHEAEQEARLRLEACDDSGPFLKWIDAMQNSRLTQMSNSEIERVMMSYAPSHALSFLSPLNLPREDFSRLSRLVDKHTPGSKLQMLHYRTLLAPRTSALRFVFGHRKQWKFLPQYWILFGNHVKPFQSQIYSFDKALEISPGAFSAVVGKSKALLDSGNPEGAAACLSQCDWRNMRALSEACDKLASTLVALGRLTP